MPHIAGVSEEYHSIFVKLESTVNALICVNEWAKVSKNKSARWLEKEIHTASKASSQDQQVLDTVQLNQ
jgi:hypothetical protein